MSSGSTMSRTVKKPMNHKNTQRVEQRLEILEKRLSTLFERTNATFSQVRENMNDLAETVSAIVSISDVEKIKQAVIDARIAKVEKDSEEDALSLKALLDDGKMVQTEAITEGSFIVLTQRNANGDVMHPVKTRVSIVDLASEKLRAEIVGHKVGDKLPLEDGGEIEILEIYEVVAAAT